MIATGFSMNYARKYEIVILNGTEKIINS